MNPKVTRGAYMFAAFRCLVYCIIITLELYTIYIVSSPKEQKEPYESLPLFERRKTR